MITDLRLGSALDREIEAMHRHNGGLSDITLWYAQHDICPSCGINLRTMHPMANLYPHFTGACAEPRPVVSKPEERKPTSRLAGWLWFLAIYGTLAWIIYTIATGLWDGWQ